MLKLIDSKKLIIFLSIIILLSYIFGIIIISISTNTNFNKVIIYNYSKDYLLNSFVINYLIKPLTVISGLFLILFVPGIIFTLFFLKDKRSFNITNILSLGFFLNIILIFLGSTLLKLFGITIDRLWLLIIIIIEMSLGIVLILRNKLSTINILFKDFVKKILYIFIFIIPIISFIFFFPTDIFYPLPINFSYDEKDILRMNPVMIGDPQEEFGIAYHLKKRILPYWLIDDLNKFSIYIFDPHLSYFINFFVITLLGESYASLDILTLVFTVGIFLFIYKIITLGEKKFTLFSCVSLLFFMFGLLFSMMESASRPELPFGVWPSHSLWDPIETLWIFLMVGFIFFLLKNELILSFLYSILVTFCRYESVLFIFLLLSLYYLIFKKDRKFISIIFKYYIIFLIIFVTYTVALCLFTNGGKYLQLLLKDKFCIRFDFLRKKINFISTIEDKIWPYFSLENTWYILRSALIYTYFFIIFFIIPSPDKIINYLSLFGLIYFSLIILQSHKLINYIWIIIPLSAVNIRRFIYSPLKIKLCNFVIYVVIYFLVKFYITK